jgi:hypothetical protein
MIPAEKKKLERPDLAAEDRRPRIGSCQHECGADILSIDPDRFGCRKVLLSGGRSGKQMMVRSLAGTNVHPDWKMSQYFGCGTRMVAVGL